MSASKLTETDQQTILDLFCHRQETIASLADRYSVSSSTISRYLKKQLEPHVYETLIQQKRGQRPTATIAPDPEPPPELEPEPEPIISAPSPVAKLSRAQQLELLSTAYHGGEAGKTSAIVPSSAPPAAAEGDDSEEEDWDDGDDAFDGEEEEGDDEEEGNISPLTLFQGALEVLPLTAAAWPRMCYLVVDRSAELITRPLKDFGDLGQIPPEETSQITLPIFDNHRVARRFSNRRERVIKVPNPQIFLKATDHLAAKGITRLLLDGQVYRVDHPVS